ncbi:CBASS cGAMP synthase [Cupriavidus plantarum]|uniref:CBASS cGAMP synthase n=1 Tax=Cupriavidus plantarum TaxID=942865 RepID=UPI001B2B123F|nr:nucleotidyltransferase [Cupriavidus plantarum]CAG2145545.1 hypothetical protein LMG26296_03763 [Cupriavidus plantarum]SMR86746.1 hypothetical protein SAMN05421735_5585 [Cupriavidus plantarum]
MGNASRLFNGAAEQTLYGRVTPTTRQREFLQEQWNALAEHLKAELGKKGYPISTWLQGSYKYGTLIKPVRKGEEYDVDVGLYFGWHQKAGGAWPSPVQLRQWVQDELVRHSKTNRDIRSIEEPKERCSRVIYAEQFHIDTPTYHLDTVTQERRLACLSNKWEASDPKGIYVWFRDALPVDERELLRRLIRYLKAWAAITFDALPDARPSSIVLTVVATQVFQGLRPMGVQGMADDDALATLVRGMYGRFVESSRVPNPVNRDEDLNRIPRGGWNVFLGKLNALMEAGDAAQVAEDEASAAFAWATALSYLMPLPEADIVEVEGPAGNALMPIPEIRIDVYDREGGNLQATYYNEIPSIERRRWLVFSIANPHVIPAYAHVEWTVRNCGEDADTIGDLGHSRGGIGMLESEESTQYIGKHFMDCVIRCNGTIHAVRRVQVNIRANPAKFAGGTRRAWMGLRTRVGRR